jgi:hypothetical protein
MDIAVGRTRQFVLRGAVGAGNSWSAVVDRDDHVLADIIITPPEKGEGRPGEPPPANTTAVETLLLTGISPGSVTVCLRLGRPWEPEAPLAQWQISVACIPDPDIAP